jgi:hypothetical protein
VFCLTLTLTLIQQPFEGGVYIWKRSKYLVLMFKRIRSKNKLYNTKTHKLQQRNVISNPLKYRPTAPRTFITQARLSNGYKAFLWPFCRKLASHTHTSFCRSDILSSTKVVMKYQKYPVQTLKKRRSGTTTTYYNTNEQMVINNAIEITRGNEE